MVFVMVFRPDKNKNVCIIKIADSNIFQIFGVIFPSAKSSTLIFNPLQTFITLVKLELPIPLLKMLSNVVYGMSIDKQNSRMLL